MGQLGLINHKFTIGEDENKNRIFRMNHVAPHYEFNYNSLDNTITLIFHGNCLGEATFKQK